MTECFEKNKVAFCSLCLLLGVTFAAMLSPQNAYAADNEKGIWAKICYEVESAWQATVDYFNNDATIKKVSTECGKVTDTAGEQLSKSMDQINTAVDVDFGDLFSNSGLNKYEERAAEHIKKVDDYENLVRQTTGVEPRKKSKEDSN